MEVAALVVAIIAGLAALATLAHDVLGRRSADQALRHQQQLQAEQADTIRRLLEIEERRASKEAAADAERAALLEEQRRHELSARLVVTPQPTARNEPRRLRVANEGMHAATVRAGVIRSASPPGHPPFITEDWMALPADVGPGEALSWPVHMARGALIADLTWTDGTGEHSDAFAVEL